MKTCQNCAYRDVYSKHDGESPVFICLKPVGDDLSQLWVRMTPLWVRLTDEACPKYQERGK